MGAQDAGNEGQDFTAQRLSVGWAELLVKGIYASDGLAGEALSPHLEYLGVAAGRNSVGVHPAPNTGVDRRIGGCVEDDDRSVFRGTRGPVNLNFVGFAELGTVGRTHRVGNIARQFYLLGDPTHKSARGDQRLELWVFRPGGAGQFG